MPDALISFLGRHGPALSSAAIEYLVEHENMSPAAARKRLQRAKPPVRQLPLLRLAHNERVFFLGPQRGTDQFVRNVTRLLDAAGSVYAHTIHSIEARGGACSARLMPTFSGCPTRRKGQLGYEIVLNNLVQVGLIAGRDLAGLGSFFVAADSDIASLPVASLRARALAEVILLGGLRDWLRRLGLVSYEAASIRGPSSLPEFGGYHWDLVGPSYVRPLASGTKTGLKPGFVVADVILGKRLSSLELRYLVRKAQVLRSAPATRPFIAILVADDFAKEAWNAGRREGLVVATPSRLFGEAVARALSDLLRTLADAGAAATKDPTAVWNLFDQLAKIEGAAANLRGPLFEMIAGHLVHAHEGRSIEIGRIVRTAQHDQAEIDVLATRQDSTLVIECKGRAGGHAEAVDTLKQWLEVKVPRIVRWIRSHDEYATLPCIFEYWTTGTFSRDAADYLRSRQAQTRAYKISWRDAEAVLQYARDAHAHRVIETLNEHYFRHPLAAIASDEDSAAAP